MQTTITAKLKLGTTPEQFTALRQIQLAYRDALNQASQYAFAHGKTSNRQRMHHALYDEVRATYGLPSRAARAVSFARWGRPTKDSGRNGPSTSKPARGAGRRSAFLGLEKPPHSVAPAVTSVCGRDLTFKAA